MYRILFVCHGNICRSPMAEFVLRDMLKKRGVDNVLVESAATSTEEIGNGVHYGTKKILNGLGIDCSFKTARQMTRHDGEEYDLLLGMDSRNILNMKRMTDSSKHDRIHRLLDYSERPGDIADPWYTGDFDRTYNDVLEGCTALLEYLSREGII